jgi:hypothetical protein
MDRCPDIGFDSYDRFFPSQDTMPAGAFGNLIALPLQNRPRENGNSVFLDDDFRPYDDQWAYLSTVGRLSRGELMSITADAAASGQIIGVRLPSTEEDDEPWTARPSRSAPIRDRAGGSSRKPTEDEVSQCVVNHEVARAVADAKRRR